MIVSHFIFSNVYNLYSIELLRLYPNAAFKRELSLWINSYAKYSQMLEEFEKDQTVQNQ
jgi:hypothetical protein